MREILFKAKRIDNGEWIEGHLIRYGYAGQEKWHIVPYYASVLYTIKIDPSTICQYTGMTDKNEKKIWENDIMVAHLDDEFPEDVTYTRILWNNNGFCINENHSEYFCPLDKFVQIHYEVCGNIFDNPELLEVGDGD